MDKGFSNLRCMSTDTQQRLAAYKAAELQILQGQTVRFGERELTRADLREVRRAIGELQRAVNHETARTRGSLAGFKQANFGGCR